MVFAERLKSLTFELRRREKEHYAKVQELHGGNTNRFSNDIEMDGCKPNGIPDDMMMQTSEDAFVDQSQSNEI